MIALLIALAQTTAAPPVPASFSVLVPTPALPCIERPKDGDVVVCGRRGEPAPLPRLPLPDERGPPDHAVPSNPDLTGSGAMAAAPPCAAYQGGCQVGFGNVDLIKLGRTVAQAVGRAVANPVDRSGRTAIPLDDPVPGHAQP